MRDPETETGSLSYHGQRFSSNIDGIDGRFSCFKYGLENGDFRQVHEGKMANQLEALSSKMVTTFCRPVITADRKMAICDGLEVFRETTTFAQTARGNSS